MSKSKRGLSAVVVSILLILLALISVIIVWTLITNLTKNTDKITIAPYTNNVKIDEAKIGLLTAQVKITRTSGNANITALRFLFDDGINTYQYDQTTNLPQEQESRTYTINLSNGVKPSSTIKVIPIFGKTIGMENTITGTTDLTSNMNRGLVAYYKFEGDARDSSGNGNDGTISGDIQFTNAKNEKGAQFDATDDYITINNQNVINNNFGNLSISVWINDTGKNREQWGTIINKNTCCGSNGFWLSIENTNSIYFYSEYINGINNNVGKGTIPINRWSHLAIVHNGTALTTYINGNSQGSVNSKTIVSNLNGLLIGKENSGTGYYKLNGTLDELMIFNRSLSELEIKQIYNSQK